MPSFIMRVLFVEDGGNNMILQSDVRRINDLSSSSFTSEKFANNLVEDIEMFQDSYTRLHA